MASATVVKAPNARLPMPDATTAAAAGPLGRASCCVMVLSFLLGAVLEMAEQQSVLLRRRKSCGCSSNAPGSSVSPTDLGYGNYLGDEGPKETGRAGGQKGDGEEHHQGI